VFRACDDRELSKLINMLTIESIMEFLVESFTVAGVEIPCKVENAMNKDRPEKTVQLGSVGL
jgi:hypothetical protein